MNGRSLTGHEASVGPEIFVGVLARERHRDGKRMLSEEVSTDGPGDRFVITRRQSNEPTGSRIKR